ncbi:hypothetical protein P7C70_g1501, partial [Phenoliferia sp. Uapishka_3]
MSAHSLLASPPRKRSCSHRHTSNGEATSDSDGEGPGEIDGPTRPPTRPGLTASSSPVIIGISGPHRARPAYHIDFPPQLVSATRHVERRLVYTFHSHVDELRGPVDPRTGIKKDSAKPDELTATDALLAQIFDETRLAAEDLPLAWRHLSPARLRNLGNFMHLNAHWLADQADKALADQAWLGLPSSTRAQAEMVAREEEMRDANEKDFVELTEQWRARRVEMVRWRRDLRAAAGREDGRRSVMEWETGTTGADFPLLDDLNSQAAPAGSLGDGDHE